VEGSAPNSGFVAKKRLFELVSKSPKLKECEMKYQLVDRVLKLYAELSASTSMRRYWSFETIGRRHHLQSGEFCKIVQAFLGALLTRLRNHVPWVFGELLAGSTGVGSRGFRDDGERAANGQGDPNLTEWAV
jgi:hypothetical protein